MPLGYGNETFDERLRKNKDRIQAAAQGKSVQDFLEDRQHIQDIADIEADNKANEAKEAAEVQASEFAPAEVQPESEVAKNARLEGLRQANVLRGGGVPEKKDTGTYTALDTASAVQAEEELALSDLEGFMPDSPETKVAAGGQADAEMFMRDEDNAIVKNARQLQKDAVEDKPGAKEAQKEIYASLSHSERQLKKEELGNYYIGPGGYAYNIDAIEASDKEFLNLQKLQHFPAHQRPHMMCKWGYIDPEDCKDLPDSDLVRTKEMELSNKLAERTLIEEGLGKRQTVTEKGLGERLGTSTASTEKVVKMRTASAETIATRGFASTKEIQTMRGRLQKTLQKNNLDFEKIKNEGVINMHSSDNKIKKWLKQKDTDLKFEDIALLRETLKQEMKFKFKQLTGKESFQTKQLGQQNAQFNLAHGLKTTDQQQAWLVKKHDMTMSRLREMMKYGQVEAAMYEARKQGFTWAPDIKAYWRSRAKDAPIDNPGAVAAFAKAGYSAKGKNFSQGINKYVARKGEYFDKLDSETPDKESGLRPIEAWVRNNQNNKNYRKEPLGPTWSEMPEAEKEEWNQNKGGYAGWKSGMLMKAVNAKMQQDPTWSDVHNAFQSSDLEYKKKADDTTGGPKTTDKTPDETAETVEKVEPEVKPIDADELRKKLNTFNKTFEGGGEYKKTNIAGLVPKKGGKLTANDVFSYGQQAFNKEEWQKGPDAGTFSAPGAYGRQPDFMKEMKWTTKPQMYDYFLDNPEELNHVEGPIRMQIIKEIRNRTRNRLPKKGR